MATFHEALILHVTIYFAGSRLLTGGDYIQVWEFVPTTPDPSLDTNHDPSRPVASEEPQTSKVSFHLGGAREDDFHNPVTYRLVQTLNEHDLPQDAQYDGEAGGWECVWRVR